VRGLYRGGSFNILRHLFKTQYRESIRVRVKKKCVDLNFDRNTTSLIAGTILSITDCILLHPI
jgi:hypothetical protein